MTENPERVFLGDYREFDRIDEGKTRDSET
jgi:hypothetical protein